MTRHSEAVSTTMLHLVGEAFVVADGAEFRADTAKHRLLALAALGPLIKPTEALVDAAQEAASFDAH